jgi:hypothetical protein
MKRNEILGEHKKGIKAVKYNKKPQDPAAEHAKAKEKLKPIKPMEGRFDRRDAYQRDYDSSVSGFGSRRNPAEDESNLLYIYKNGRVHQSMISNYNEREARAQGFRDTPEQALKLHGIIQSKFKPGKWVQKQGTQWAEVHPFGKADEPDMDEAMGDPVGTVSSATPDGKVSIKTSTGDEIQTSKDALIPGANGTLQMKPDAAGGALKPGAKVVSTAEDMTAPTTDSASPINGDEENVDLRRLRELAGQPAAPGGDVDPGEQILNIAANPEVKAFIEANTVRDAEGDVDLAGTFGKMATKASAEMDVKGLQDAVAQLEVKFKEFPSSPEFKALTPEEQQEWTQKAPEGLKLMQDMAAQLVKLQQTFADAGKQATDFSQDPNAPKDNPMKGVKTLVPQQPVEEGTEDGKDLSNGFTLTTTDFQGKSVPAIFDTQDNAYWIENNSGSRQYGIASHIQIKDGKAKGMSPGPQTAAAMKAAGWKISDPKPRTEPAPDTSANEPFVPKDYQTKEPLTKGPDGKWRNSKGEERDSLHGGPISSSGGAMFRSLTPRTPTPESADNDLLQKMLSIAGLR